MEIYIIYNDIKWSGELCQTKRIQIPSLRNPLSAHFLFCSYHYQPKHIALIEQVFWRSITRNLTNIYTEFSIKDCPHARQFLSALKGGLDTVFSFYLFNHMLTTVNKRQQSDNNVDNLKQILIFRTSMILLTIFKQILSTQPVALCIRTTRSKIYSRHCNQYKTFLIKLNNDQGAADKLQNLKYIKDFRVKYLSVVLEIYCII